MKCLIIGGGNAALRYVESLLWDNDIDIVLCSVDVCGKTRKLARDFNLPIVSIQELSNNTINSYKCIIVCLPPLVKTTYVKHIIDGLGYLGTLILEKPLAITYEDLRYYEDLLIRLKQNCAVLCLRDYLPETYSIPSAPQYDIVFYSELKDFRNNIIHQLPHVLSWLYTNKHIVKSVRVIDNNLVGETANGTFSITFESNMDSPGVIINGIKYPPLNYRKFLLNAVKEILLRNAALARNDMEKAIKVASFICQILENQPNK